MTGVQTCALPIYTTSLFVYQEIYFSEPVIGGLMPSVPYFISDIKDDQHFSVSATPGGAVQNLTDAVSGTTPMMATAINEPNDPDYITISRDSDDLNAWSRSNRWFHKDVINATAQYNNTLPLLPREFNARRPIVQFRGGIRLYNMGTQGKQPVDIIDFDQTDALSNVEGSTSYTQYGYTFQNGTRVVFAIFGNSDRCFGLFEMIQG